MANFNNLLNLFKNMNLSIDDVIDIIYEPGQKTIKMGGDYEIMLHVPRMWNSKKNKLIYTLYCAGAQYSDTIAPIIGAVVSIIERRGVGSIYIDINLYNIKKVLEKSRTRGYLLNMINRDQRNLTKVDNICRHVVYLAGGCLDSFSKEELKIMENEDEYEVLKNIDKEVVLKALKRAVETGAWSRIAKIMAFDPSEDLLTIVNKNDYWACYDIWHSRPFRKEDIDRFFKENFRYLPKIRYLLANNLDLDEIKGINFKKLGKVLKHFAGELTFDYVYKFYKMSCADVLMSKGISASDAHDILATGGENLIENTEVQQFVASYYGKASTVKILTVLKYHCMVNDFSFKWKLEEMYEACRRVELEQGYSQYIEEFQCAGYSINEIKKKEMTCSNTIAKCGSVTARVLEAGDPLGLALGDLTSCCQKIGSAGESCCIAGMIRPDSGFLVFERGPKVLAQAWIWEGGENTIVLDNIEFADFTYPQDIKDALKLWVEACPYANVHLGLGYNDMPVAGPRVTNSDIVTLCDYDGYSDYGPGKAVWLKRNNKVVFQ